MMTLVLPGHKKLRQSKLKVMFSSFYLVAIKIQFITSTVISIMESSTELMNVCNWEILLHCFHESVTTLNHLH